MAYWCRAFGTNLFLLFKDSLSDVFTSTQLQGQKLKLNFEE